MKAISVSHEGAEVRGTVNLPASKSIANRLLLMRAVAGFHDLQIHNLSNARDTVILARILPELEPQLAEAPRLSTLRGYVAHGTYDDKLPVSWAQRADDWLTRLGVAHETKLYPAGHELGAAMRADFLAWLARGDQRWNRPGARQ